MPGGAIFKGERLKLPAPGACLPRQWDQAQKELMDVPV
jgi:hypothetical protein